MENFKVISEKENSLFNRKELEFNIQSQVTPSNIDIEKFIAEKFSVQPELIKIKGIYGGFGSKIFKVKANIYKSIEDKESIEPKSKKKKEVESKSIEQMQVTEQAAPETPAEKPAEEIPKEEPKSEEKPEEKPAEEKPKEETKEEVKE